MFMKNKLFMILSRIIMGISFASLISCSSCSSEHRAKRFCMKTGWYGSLPALPSENTDLRELSRQIRLNPDGWDNALAFLKNPDLAFFEDGRYDLGNGTYANVQSYLTKDSAYFEYHKSYTDIQYMLSGAEIIETAPTDSLCNPISPYDKGSDIGFYKDAKYKDVTTIDSSRFMVLFPKDGHKPCIMCEKSAPVKKVVIKMPYIQ